MSHRFVGKLRERHVQLRPQFFLAIAIQAPLVYMPHHADDLRRTIRIISEVQPFTQRILARKIFAGQHVVDHHDSRAALIILRIEKTPALQRNAHHFQVVGAHHIIQRPLHLVPRRRCRLAIDPEQPLVIGAQRNRAGSNRNGFHTRRGLKCSLYFTKSRADRVGLGVGHRRRQGQTQRQNLAGIESRIHIPQRAERAQHQSRAHQQHQR